MNEFSLIEHFFKKGAIARPDVVYGIGDDAACLTVPTGMQLLVSTDTLVAEVHFLSSWDAYDIAYKAVMVNVSDMAAMAAEPCWLSLALTLPELNTDWLTEFAKGLHAALQRFDIALIGGDTTRGPLSMTLTIHGLAPAGKAIRRCTAKPGDSIYVSGTLGAAALAVEFLQDLRVDPQDKQQLMQKLLHPEPRVDLRQLLQTYASATIDISDGLAADLNHICVASAVGARLSLTAIPVHPLVKKYKGVDAVDFALSGGDDYELCFTVSAENEESLIASMKELGLSCYAIGKIEAEEGMRSLTEAGESGLLKPRGYSHF